MSRFWAAGSSSDDDSSDDDSSFYSSDESGGGRNENRWVAMSDDSESEDSVRVVKSAKERALESFDNHIKNLRNAMKIRDYFAIQTEFDELAKDMIKAKQVLAEGVPRSLVRILVELEDYIKERGADKAHFKKLSARQSRALNRMKLTLRKHNKPYGPLMTEYRKNPVVDDSDDESSDDESSGSDSSSSSDSEASNVKPAKKKSTAASDSESSDSDSDSDEDSDDDSGSENDSGSDDENSVGSDSDWASSSDSSSSEDEAAGAYSQLKGRARWLKKNTAVSTKVVKNKDERAKARNEAKAAAVIATKAMEAVTATKSIIPEASLTPSILNRKVKEIAAHRGRRGKDNRVLLRQLEALLRLSFKFGPRVEVPILMYVISAQFSLNRTMDDCMETSTWKSCASYLQRIADVLDSGYSLGVETVDESDLLLNSAGMGGGIGKMKAAASAAGTEGGAMAAVAADEKLINPHTGEVETEDERAERVRLEKEAAMTEEELKTIPVVGSLSLHLTRLEEEYTKSLQQISHHSEKYVVRLRDESKLVELLMRVQSYFDRVGAVQEAAQLAQLRVEHLYYRHDIIAKHVDKAAEFYEKFGEASMLHPGCVSSDDSGTNSNDFTKVHPASALGKPIVDNNSVAQNTNWTTLMAKLCTFVYKNGTEKAKTRAIICHVYHHALHDRFLEARDLLLMSHIQENIYGCGDVSTMILFNRMMVTLGMCAFRLGRINDAHQCLADVCSGRLRELLAQGVHSSRFSDKSAEQEKAEKRRQVPYHQHINMDLLEACHLISAMLLEVPNMAASMVDGEINGAAVSRRSRVISRTFRKFHDQYDHQVFTGPPEQTRDYVMRASKALLKGDWKTCASLVSNLDVWKLVPGDNACQQIQNMLVAKIRLEGLRTYLFAFSGQYDSLSLQQLCGMFDMNKNEVHSVVSKMMINRELYASWDQPTETIVLRKVEPSPLQVMALQFAEKAAGLVEANERLLDSQNGSYGYKDEYWKGGDGEDRFSGRSGGYYRGGGRYGRRGGGGHRNRGRRNNYQ